MKRLVLGLLATLWWGGPGAAETLRVEYEDGRAPSQIDLERTEPGSQEWYVSANGLARLLDVERFWKAETGKLVFKVDEHRLQVTVDTRLVLVDDEEALLIQPVHYRAGSVMIPLEFVETFMEPAAAGAWKLDRRTLTLTVGRMVTDVLGIEYETSSGDTEVRIRLSDDFPHRVQATSHEMVRVRIFDAVVDPLALTADAPAPLLRSLRAEQRGREALLYLELDRDVDGFDSTTRNGGRTLIVTLRRRLDAMPLPEFKLPESTQHPGAAAREERCDVLLLDAGHGGNDTGVHASGLLEKDLNLELVTKMKPRLEAALSMRVELVRSSDRTLSDERRAELANKSGGDLLISVHSNGWFDASARGFEVLFVGPRAVEEAGANAVAAQDFRPWKSSQTPFAARSQSLAQLLQDELEKHVILENRGAREANLDFLRGLAMPAVMVEVGFLTNPAEADILLAPDFADALADAIAASVRRYCADLGGNPGRFGAGRDDRSRQIGAR
jgi:N-acetylmuramoyl-L-alanine amidase